MDMIITWERVAANFIVGFATAFMAISMVDGLPEERRLYVGILGGVAQGLLSAGRELLLETEGDKKGQLSLLQVF